MSADLICKRFFVSGRVQGVFFRGSTAAEADRLGIRGHAVNLDDGRVEVLALGAVAAVDELARWLHHGPRWAEVHGVEERVEDPVAVQLAEGFATG